MGVGEGGILISCTRETSRNFCLFFFILKSNGGSLSKFSVCDGFVCETGQTLYNRLSAVLCSSISCVWFLLEFFHGVGETKKEPVKQSSIFECTFYGESNFFFMSIVNLFRKARAHMQYNFFFFFFCICICIWDGWPEMVNKKWPRLLKFIKWKKKLQSSVISVVAPISGVFLPSSNQTFSSFFDFRFHFFFFKFEFSLMH